MKISAPVKIMLLALKIQVYVKWIHVMEYV